VITNPLEFLLKAQTPQGGWGYHLGQTPGVEPTCAVLLAAKDRSHTAEFQKAVEWLLSIQRQDGGWGINGEDLSSCWQTAWAVWVLPIIGIQGQPIKRGIGWLLKENVMAISDLDDLEAGRRIAGIDFSLRGWPWQAGEASWVEPTALTMLALASASASNDRLLEAVRYLENRRCPGGGWNVGNPVMFNAFLPARVNPSAWSMMALARTSPQTISPDDAPALRTEIVKDGGAMGMAWGCLALRTCGIDVPADLLDLLAAKQSTNGSWDENPYVTAVAWMAFQENFQA